jgi:glucoamylase
MTTTDRVAPGWPGIPPRWTSSAKTGVGTALNRSSRVWFTISHGILNEVYYPRVDRACTRDLGLIVTDGAAFFSEEKRHANCVIEQVADGVPAFRLTNTCADERYRIEKEVVADPVRDSILQRTRFTPLVGGLRDYHLFALLAPHLNNQGADNTAWIGDYKGVPMLFAARGDTALALACSPDWMLGSAGFVGVSDGWQQLSRHGRLTETYGRAEHGNVALTGEIDLASADGVFTLALAFGSSAMEAGMRARASLQGGFDAARSLYMSEWSSWHQGLAELVPPEQLDGGRDLYRVSTSVMRTHEAKRFPGGLIASLSIPWGQAKGDEDLGGYHLVWPRDLAEVAGGLLAAGASDDADRVIHYLEATQEDDGHWPQNMWLDGEPYWTGLQMDETAFPILLVDLARRQGALESGDIERLWPMVRKAASFLVSAGPVTPQDRLEEDPGYSPFTLAVQIAALLAAADVADLNGEPQSAQYLRETADAWNEGVERWTYVTDTPLARKHGVDGYYVRIAPPDVAESDSPAEGYVPIKNRPPGESDAPASQLVSPDALALVRFGLRAADDPRIVDTVKVLDALLLVETPVGRSWRRYNGDGYGEHDDGSPFDGTGEGRAWPLLTGERAHYELAAGRRDQAVELLHTMEMFASDGGLIPEQVWDSSPVPDSELAPGRPSGSAMPLVWAHAEYVKLRRSIQDGRVFDSPPQPFARYVVEKRRAGVVSWCAHHKIRRIRTGQWLRLECREQSLVSWSRDNWATSTDVDMRASGIGPWIADLPVAEDPAGTVIAFTFRRVSDGTWDGLKYQVAVEAADRTPAGRAEISA